MNRKPSTVDAEPQAYLSIVLHDDERLGAGSDVRRAGFENLCDTGVLKPAENLRLLLEAAEHLPGCRPTAQHFERDAATRVVLLGFIHDSHAAFAQDADDAIAADRSGSGSAGRLSPDEVMLDGLTQRIVTASGDSTARLWDAGMGALSRDKRTKANTSSGSGTPYACLDESPRDRVDGGQTSPSVGDRR